jgi:hypothetical protein
MCTLCRFQFAGQVGVPALQSLTHLHILYYLVGPGESFIHGIRGKYNNNYSTVLNFKLWQFRAYDTRRIFTFTKKNMKTNFKKVSEHNLVE